MNMNKIIIKSKSSFCQEIQSDTLFGHICWAIKYLYGEDELTKFIKEFDKEPPILLSSGFPKVKDTDFIPKPILRPLNTEEEGNLKKEYFSEKKEYIFYSSIKFLNKQNFIPLNILEKLKDNLSYFNLYRLIFIGECCPVYFVKRPPNCSNFGVECVYFSQKKKECELSIKLVKLQEVYHNTINRITNTVLKEGGLFSVLNYFYNSDIVIYIKDTYLSVEKIKKIFEFISYSGYGKDKSTGKGSFDFEIEEGYNLPGSSDPNAFLVLSNFYPKEEIDGYYDIITKFGKLGGDWVRSKNPFKKPIIFVKPGSVIFTEELKEYYGILVRDIHQDKRIVQYGYTIPLGVKIL